MIMYKSIYLPLDNSAHSLRGVDLAIALAKAGGAALAGSHVYAAKLHDRRFRQMEGGLPEAYKKEEKLVEQRDIHDDLITRGLQVISDSYLDVFEAKCEAAGLAGRSVSLEGKNWQALVKDIAASDCDLVVMGALGLGAVEASQLGSVCERVARRVDRDLLVIRDIEDHDGAIVVALDGSPQSYGGLMTALELARVFKRPVEAVAAFDPDFHYVAFNSIAKVLSPEAASVFRFQEQERLHEEIIDSGLAKIYQGHLDVAKRIAADEGVALSIRLLSGKAFEQLLRYARETKPWLMLLGRIGVHSEAGMDLGSATENLLRLAPCNLLLSARCFEPPIDHIAETTMSWTEEAEARMRRVPEFVRGMARKSIIKQAAERGHTVVTSDVIDAVLGRMPGGAAMGGGKCPFAHNGPPKKKDTDEEPALSWEPAALARLDPMPPSVRDHARLRIEKMARRTGESVITEAMVDAATRAVTEMLG
ncbi:MAG: universal stress protein UspA [Rhodocyclaceae bacterium]|jgi:nucleotide-binding universal stress UspA family protein|nr:universal stress protein UspA [Rhodocyclaceae bacterium]